MLSRIKIVTLACLLSACVCTTAVQNVSTQNLPPVVSNPTATLDEDTSVVVHIEAYDPEGGPLTYSYQQPIFGGFSGPGPDLLYRPRSNFFGQVRFTFRVSDDASPPNVVTQWGLITVNPVNDPPRALIGVADAPTAINIPGASPNLLIMTRHGESAAGIVLDGSYSELDDVDGDTLDFLWLEGTNVVSQTALLDERFDVGLYTVELIVSDYELSDVADYTFEVITPVGAVSAMRAVLDQATIPSGKKRMLDVPLRRAVKELERGALNRAIRRLESFQQKTDRNFDLFPGGLASELVRAAQRIIDVLIEPGVSESH